jgi:hypothetical protein
MATGAAQSTSSGLRERPCVAAARRRVSAAKRGALCRCSGGEMNHVLAVNIHLWNALVKATFPRWREHNLYSGPHLRDESFQFFNQKSAN